MARNGCNCYFLFWAIFCLFTPLTAQKIKILKKWNQHLEISSFYICVPKLWSDDVQFLRYGARQTDGWTEVQKKWHIEVGTPPKNRTWIIDNVFLCYPRRIPYQQTINVVLSNHQITFLTHYCFNKQDILTQIYFESLKKLLDEWYNKDLQITELPNGDANVVINSTTFFCSYRQVEILLAAGQRSTMVRSYEMILSGSEI